MDVFLHLAYTFLIIVLSVVYSSIKFMLNLIIFLIFLFLMDSLITYRFICAFICNQEVTYMNFCPCHDFESIEEHIEDEIIIIIQIEILNLKKIICQYLIYVKILY